MRIFNLYLTDATLRLAPQGEMAESEAWWVWY